MNAPQRAAVTVRLEQMNQSQYNEFLSASLKGYAANKAKSENLTEQEGMARSREVHARLLPEGFTTADNYFFLSQDSQDGQTVGLLWFELRGEPGRKEAFIDRVEVTEAARGRGFGRATMRAFIERARELGANSVRLHVFGHNHVARSLYSSLGFAEVDVVMSLSLD